jgi:hypothetical protein
MMAYSRNATRRGQGKGLQIAAVGADMYAWTEAGVGLTSLVRRGNMGGRRSTHHELSIVPLFHPFPGSKEGPACDFFAVSTRHDCEV